MHKGAIRKYVRNEFEARELASNSDPRSATLFNKGRVLVSEVVQELLKRDYRYIVSKFGFALSLNGPDQLEEVVKRFQHRLRYLYVHTYSKRWLRPNECLDFELLTAFSDLRGLSVGYMLKSCNASAIEKLSKLEHLALAWKIDEAVDLQKLERLRELVIFWSPFLESVWDLTALEKLAVNHHLYGNLESASRLANVEKLTIRDSKNLKSVKGVGGLRRLQFLGLYGNSNLVNLDFVSGAQSLEYIVIENCSSLESISEIADLPNLKYLEVRDCSSLKSVDIFSAQSNLAHVFFTGDTRLDRPIEEIVGALPKLEYFFTS